jgi:hypothetical protein
MLHNENRMLEKDKDNLEKNTSRVKERKKSPKKNRRMNYQKT